RDAGCLDDVCRAGAVGLADRAGRVGAAAGNVGPVDGRREAAGGLRIGAVAEDGDLTVERHTLGGAYRGGGHGQIVRFGDRGRVAARRSAAGDAGLGDGDRKRVAAVFTVGVRDAGRLDDVYGAGAVGLADCAGGVGAASG